MDNSEVNYVKKEFKLHLIYWAIVFFLLAVFLLLIAPGCVNKKAFENFSFASTIVSIVLAVVSIVYSFRTKSNSSENMAGIREIEKSIENKLNRFDTLKSEIIEEVKGITRPIEDEVGNIRLVQEEASKQMSKMLEKMSHNERVSIERVASGKLLGSASFFGNVMMYVLSKGNEVKKEIDFDKIETDLKDNFDYLYGFWVALNALRGKVFDYELKDRVLTVTKYDDSKLGDSAYWRKMVEGYKDKAEAKKYLDAVDAYFVSSEGGNSSSDIMA